MKRDYSIGAAGSRERPRLRQGSPPPLCRTEVIREEKSILVLLAVSFAMLFVLYGCGSGGGDIITASGDWTDASLRWDPPTTNEDGTPLTDLAGYKLYYGPSPGNYSGSLDVGDTTTVLIATVVDSIDGSLPATDTICFAVTAYDTYGNESDYSNEVCQDL